MLLNFTRRVEKREKLEVEFPLYLKVNGYDKIGSKWRQICRKVYIVDGYMRSDVIIHESTAGFGVVDSFSVDYSYDQTKLESEFGDAEHLTEERYLQELAMALGRLSMNGFKMTTEEINERRDGRRRILAKSIVEKIK